MLSNEQIAHFRTFGFLVIRQAFTGEEVEALVREADGAYAEKTARAYAEKTATGPTRRRRPAKTTGRLRCGLRGA